MVGWTSESIILCNSREDTRHWRGPRTSTPNPPRPSLSNSNLGPRRRLFNYWKTFTGLTRVDVVLSDVVPGKKQGGRQCGSPCITTVRVGETETRTRTRILNDICYPTIASELLRGRVMMNVRKSYGNGVFLYRLDPTTPYSVHLGWTQRGLPRAAYHVRTIYNQEW